MKRWKIEIILIFVLVVLILVIKNVTYKSFIDYENTILFQQREHLLTIAKSSAKSLKLHIDEKEKALSSLANSLSIKAKEIGLTEKIISSELKNFYESQSGEVAELRYMDSLKEGQINYPDNAIGLGNSDFLIGFESVKRRSYSYVGKPWLDSSGNFYMYIYQSILVDNQFSGVVIAKIRLQSMYDKLLKEIKLGEKGYAMLKDSKGIILMHPVKTQIGYDVIKTRKEKFPDLDLTDLEKLVKVQLKGQEGTQIYYSYWWTQDRLRKVKKLNGFAPLKVGDDFWIVSVVMSYSEISAPIKNYFYNSSLISIIIIIAFAWTINLLIRMLKSKEAYQMESEYLRELNETTNELRKKEAELHHKRKMETIGTLTGGIAHEFNNILTPIMGYSELILRGISPDEEMYEDVKVIYDSSKRSQKIIDQILTYSDSKPDSKLEVLLLNDFLIDIKKVLLSIIPEDVKLNISIKDEKYYILGNETELHQVILNLVKNAVNATKKSNEKEITIRLEKVTKKNERSFYKVLVEDTGCGMKEETIGKIFNPFYTEKLSENSTGLGLSVALGIIKKHGGKIDVTSKLGEGSCFTLLLPQFNFGEKLNRQEKKPDENIQLTGSEKIMILDNEEFITKMLKKGLNSLGYTSRAFTNGYKLLEEFDELSKQGYQVLVTDLTMPEISGIEISKLLRMKNKDIKIILMTAHPEEPLNNYIKNGVIDGYLLKPVSAAEISRRIRKLLD